MLKGHHYYTLYLRQNLVIIGDLAIFDEIVGGGGGSEAATRDRAFLESQASKKFLWYLKIIFCIMDNQ